jgi:hypothetical protein
MSYKKVILLFLTFTFFAIVTIAKAEPVRTTTWLTFSWEPVTVNANGTPCDDLAGYAIYRSAVNADWDELTGKTKAYKVIPATNQGKYSCWCKEGGTFFWMIRAFDKTDQFSEKSNIIECFVDTTFPGTVIDFQAVTPGDINNDGDVDGKDLSIMSENFGK